MEKKDKYVTYEMLSLYLTNILLLIVIAFLYILHNFTGSMLFIYISLVVSLFLFINISKVRRKMKRK